jgi:hypothetical protein
MAQTDLHYRQSPLDITAASVVLVFAAALSLFAIRSNDIWWLLAVARRIVETKSFITKDPFTFTAPGAPWAPQAYLSALIFYAVHSVASAWGLIMLRAVLVTAIFAVSFWSLARVGVSWAIASPVVLLVLLNAHSRFLTRAHLFEYLLLVLLVGFLLTVGRRRGKSFFVFPLVLELLWVNMHPSYILGPVLVALFFGGEWLAGVLSRYAPFVRTYSDEGYDWRRAGLLVALMLAACVVNPSPHQFLTQPFVSEQRELVSRFTLEWRSPFDPALRHGAFHPYYEILLGLAGLSIVLAIRRLRLAPALLVAATAYLSFQAHRFRVEFALVALPMLFVLLQPTAVGQLLGRRRSKTRWSARAVPWVALAGSAVLIVTALGRVSVGRAVADRYPDGAFSFVRSENIGQRSFHTIGFGSYLLWDLYGERKSFIDGRNFSPSVYWDFLASQATDDGARNVAAKYDLDAFVIPPAEVSDAGIGRIHRSLAGDDRWTLCYLDEHAWIYVRNDAVDEAWLEANGLRAYHPFTFRNRRMRLEELRAAVAELERVVSVSPRYTRTRMDLALAYETAGDTERARREVDALLEIDPRNGPALRLKRRLETPGR